MTISETSGTTRRDVLVAGAGAAALAVAAPLLSSQPAEAAQHPAAGSKSMTSKTESGLRTQIFAMTFPH